MDMDLFSGADLQKKPLAEELRPGKLSELILDEKSELHAVHRAWVDGNCSSYLLWGPAGSGKTSFARLLFNGYEGPREQTNAVDVSVSDLRSILKSAESHFKFHGKSTLLFMDEGHRLKAPQQDILLPSLESGALLLISATTENPGFSFNRAFLSRVRVLKTDSVSKKGLELLVGRGLERLELNSEAFSGELIESLVERSGGDGRRLLSDLSNIKNLFVSASGVLDVKASLKYLTLSTSGGSKQLKVDALSALIKSMRASDEKAAVYYMGLLLRAHEDPQVMLRRMVIFASEDIGGANSQAVIFINSIWDGFVRVGMPEAVYSLYQACSYLALSPKSRRHVDQSAWADKTVGSRVEGITFPEHFKKFAKGPKEGASNMPDHLSGK